jgi:parallel beta-helix repeat protein
MRKKIAYVFLSLLLLGTLYSMVSTQRVKASTWTGTVYIQADGNIDPPTAPIQQNLDLYTLTDNIVSDDNGIVIERSDIKLDGNGYTVQGNYGVSGLNLTSISNVSIRNTNVEGFYYGIFLLSSSQNTISGNNLTANTIGIALQETADRNNIVGNNITENTFGIWLGASSDNNIYHNNLVNNANQVYTDSTNVWDDAYPVAGNYWSDYNGQDLYTGPFQNETGGDGIGDTPYVLDQYNIDNYPLISALIHGVGITDVSASKTIVGQGYTMNISVQIINYGKQLEIFNVTAKANSTIIQKRTATLRPATSDTLIYVWNTSSSTKGNYTMGAYATPVSGETDTADNNCTGGIVYVGIPGDVQPEFGFVDMKDIRFVAKRFGANPNSPRWDPNADINNDGFIDMKDVRIAAKNFGKTYQ